MIRRPTLVALTLVLVAAVALAAAPSEVSACSPSPIEPDERIAAFSEVSTAVVVAEVRQEEVLEAGLPFARAHVAVAAAFSGEPGEALTIEQLGQPLECMSGPRMEEGEQFLFFLTDEPSIGARNLDPGWRLAALGQGIYVLDGGEAFYYGQLNDPRQREPVGSAEDLIREVAAHLDSDPVEVDRALAFVNGDRSFLTIEPSDQESNPVTVWGSIAVGVLAVAILGGWWLRGRRSRPWR
ncbi:MAG: hypothetical protein M0R75_03905 [Dehalococcoidia bacterium]|nr:hypothetical protein [Dehalococcoidia bacterium]